MARKKSAPILTAYIQAAMRRAEYEKLEDGTYYGEIPGFDGVYANAADLESTRDLLQSVLEGWLREMERHPCAIARIEQLLTELGQPIEGPSAAREGHSVVPDEQPRPSGRSG